MSPILTDFHFIRPYFLLALIPLCLLIALTLKHKLSRGNWAEVCDEALLPYILQDKAGKTSRWPLTTIAFASIVAIVALAGPTWQQLPVPSFQNDAALVIALDLSESMNATDIKPSRLSRARFKISDILNQRKDGATALLVYAGDAFTVTPLTHDHATILSQLAALSTDIMPAQGSNSLAAIKLANQLLHQAGQQSGTILLITDEVIASQAKKIPELLGNTRLSILGIGTADGAPVKLNHGGFLKDQQGNIIIPKLDRSELAAIARSGNGDYQSITNDDRDISSLLSGQVEANNNTSTDNHLVEQWDEKGPWLLLLVLPFAALYFRKGLLIIPLVIMFNFPQNSYAFGWQDLWQTQAQQAQQSFDDQQYDQAAKQFDSPQWKAAAEYKAGNYQQAAETLKDATSPDDLYNKANALAKAGKLEEALDSYDQVLKQDPDYEDAKSNKKTVEEALKKQQQQKQDSDSNSESSKNSDKNQQQNQDQNNDQQQSDADNKDASSKQSDDQNQQQQDQAESKSDKDKSSADKNKDGQDQQDQKQAGQDNDSEEDKAQQQAQQEATDNKDQDEKSSEAAQQAEAESTNNEVDQATEQWLKRIPDDPSGLLKRKFRYQYKQRNSTQTQQEQSW